MRKSSAFGLRSKFKKNLKFLNANLRRTRLECCAAHAPHREMNPKAKTLADFHFAIHLRTLTQEKLVTRKWGATSTPWTEPPQCWSLPDPAANSAPL